MYMFLLYSKLLSILLCYTLVHLLLVNDFVLFELQCEGYHELLVRRLSTLYVFN